ncbi:MAG: hypothetical protein AAGG50_13785 [Bacteroidota bacterium]
MPDRIYTEDQVRAIIKRAVELQEHTPKPEHGLTIDELERLGEEVGLDASFLRMAASEVANTGQTLERRSDMTDTHVVVERWIEGPLSTEGWEDAIAMLRERFGIDAASWSGQSSGAGRLETVGNAQEWTHTSGLGVETRVGVSERGDRVRLRITQRVGHAKPETEGKWYGAGLGIVLGGIAGAVASSMSEIGAIFLIVFTLVTVLSTFVAAPIIEGIDRRWRKRKLSKLNALADEVISTLASPVGVPAGEATALRTKTPSGTTAAPRLTLDEEAPVNAAMAATGARTRA